MPVPTVQCQEVPRINKKHTVHGAPPFLHKHTYIHTHIGLANAHTNVRTLCRYPHTHIHLKNSKAQIWKTWLLAVLKNYITTQWKTWLLGIGGGEVLHGGVVGVVWRFCTPH